MMEDTGVFYKKTSREEVAVSTVKRKSFEVEYVN